MNLSTLSRPYVRLKALALRLWPRPVMLASMNPTAKRSRFQHRLHAVIYPAPDVPGTWISHCLELDIMSLGNSAPHALDMLAEAIQLTAAENIKDGRPPLHFRSAPADVWDQFTESDDAAVVRILQIEDARVEDEVTITPHIARAR